MPRFPSRQESHAPIRLIAWGAASIALGLCSAQFLPAMKRLSTTPFALTVSGGAILAFAVAAILLDLPANERIRSFRNKVSAPLVAMGHNSPLIYFGNHLVLHVLLSRGAKPRGLSSSPMQPRYWSIRAQASSSRRFSCA